jgi:cobalamin biosynthesis protein CbiD
LVAFSDDNRDDTQEIPVFAEVRLEDTEGNVLWKGRIDEDGLCTFKKPEFPTRSLWMQGRVKGPQ